MAYDEDEYLRYMELLEDAVGGLKDNEISLSDIKREVENAYGEA